MTRDEVIKIINQNNGILLLPVAEKEGISRACLLYTSPSPRDCS